MAVGDDREHAMVIVLACGTVFSQNLTFGSRAARPVPPWLQKSSIYELWLNRFSKEGSFLRTREHGDIGHYQPLESECACHSRLACDGLLFRSELA
jgi:hypothetical protein